MQPDDTKLAKAGLLRLRIDTLATQLATAKRELTIIEEGCTHDFGTPQRYSDRWGDGMEGNVHWRRTCVKCALEQKTFQARTKTIEVPVFAK